MAQARKALANTGRTFAIDIGDDDFVGIRAGFGGDLAPAVADQRMAVGPSAAGVVAGLVGGDHGGQILDGPGPCEDMPVGRARGVGEGRGGDDLPH